MIVLSRSDSRHIRPRPPPAGVCPDMSSGEATGQCRRRETWRAPKLKQLASRLIFYFLSLSQQWATCKLWRINLPVWKSTIYFNSKLNGKDVLTILIVPQTYSTFSEMLLIAFLWRGRWQCGCLPFNDKLRQQLSLSLNGKEWKWKEKSSSRGLKHQLFFFYLAFLPLLTGTDERGRKYGVKRMGWPAETEPESWNQNSVTADKTVTHAMQQSDHLGTINFSIWQDTVQKRNIFCHQSVFKWPNYYPEQLIK